MRLTNLIFWFLCFSVCQSWGLPVSEPTIHGTVQSPHYPGPYEPNLLKQWELWIPTGYQIQLSLEHLDMKESKGCNQDSLTVLHDPKVLGKFCGQENSTSHPGKNVILSPGNRLTLIFQTSGSMYEHQQHVGFFGTFKAKDIDECSESNPNRDGSGPLCSQICVNTPGSYHCSCYNGYKLHLDQRTCVLSCGGCMFDKPEGHLSSPGYPRPSPPYLSCKYIISVERRSVIILNFTEHFHIHTQQGPGCQQHWLQVSIPGRESMKLCGTKSPGLIATNSSTVRLDYHTDYEGLSNGWSLDYSTHEIKCTYPGKVSNGILTPVLPQYYYGDFITVKCDQNFTLMMDDQPIKTYSAMCQSNGQWQPQLPRCQMINCEEPEPLLNGGITFLSGIRNQYLSVVQYHCNEPFYSPPGGVNVTFTCAANGRWKSNRVEVETPTCVPVCGRPTQQIEGYQRIFGGSEAPEHTIPWQVLLNINGKRGGGMVIADRWILTAATTVVRYGQQVPTQSIQISMGDTDVHRMVNSFVFAASVHAHPEYNNPDGLNFNNDIALIKLQEPIIFNAAVMPLCLPAKNATFSTGLMGLVSGFGQTNDGGRQMLTNKLKYVLLPVVDQGICSDSITSWKRTRPNTPELTDNMFCVGTPEGGKDSCQGDCGGPFSLDSNGQSWAAGIVSWGIKCGVRGKYGVYTKVINYLDWINKVMQEN